MRPAYRSESLAAGSKFHSVRRAGRCATIIRLYTGYDTREADGWHAFVQSLVETSSDYRLMPPLSGKQADGTNSFTYARFAVPELCNWGGKALFVDASDMVLKADIAELVNLFDDSVAVQVVRHSYKTKHPRKYVGTDMEADNLDYERKNWSSVILWNCGHVAHYNARNEIRSAIRRGDGKFLHRFSWLKDNQIGDLPIEWNWLCDEYGENENAKLLHWTAGMPGFKHYASAPMSNEWHRVAKTFHSER